MPSTARDEEMTVKMDPSWEFAMCSVFVYVMVSQVWPQEKTRERLKKTKFIIITGPREWGQGAGRVTECQGVTREAPNFSQVAEDRSKGRVQVRAFVGFFGKERQGEQLGIGQLNNFGGLEDTGWSLVAWSLSWDDYPRGRGILPPGVCGHQKRQALGQLVCISEACS